MEDGDIEIEIYDINDYAKFKTFSLIGINQVVKGNIREIKGTCVKDKEKILYLVLKKGSALNSLSDFSSLLMDMQDDIFEAEIESEILETLETDSIEAMRSSDIMETLFVLEENGHLKYDVEREKVIYD